MTRQADMFINGQSAAPSSGEYLDSENPADGSIVAKVARGTQQDVDKAARAAQAASEVWADISPFERGKLMEKLAVAIEQNLEPLAQLDSREMGNPIGLARLAIQGSADYFHYYGGLATSVLGDTIPITSDKLVYNRYEPYGVVGVITPWNGPLNQACRSCAPALAVGNSVVLKPSEYTSLSSLELAKLATEVGFPDGVFNVVTGLGNEVGAPLVEHPLVEKVAFTGSVATGQAIAEIAAKKVMPVTLELGGKSPNIVFEDANLEAAAPMVLFGFVANTGQICTSGTRVLVQRSIFDQFSAMIAEAANHFPIGLDKEFPTLGPMANRMQFEKVLGFFESAKQQGATCLAGGEQATGPGLDQGLYIKPTIYTDVTPDMRVVREEIFGPVGVLIPFDTEEEAIQIANDTEYGLSSGVWTQNASRAHRVAAKIKAGTVYINTYHDFSIEAPMGGYKKSGLGREKGVAALHDYLQLKNVTMQLI